MSVKLSYQKSAERWQRYSEEYFNEARQYYLETNKTILNISTFLLGFIGIFIQIGNFETSLFLGKLLITAGFIFSTFSVLITLYIIRSMNCFLNKSGENYQQLSENMINWMLENNNSIGSEYPKKIYDGVNIQYKFNHVVSKFQLPTLGLGFICVAAYFMTILF